MKPLCVYDRITRNRLAYLQNAYEIGYLQQVNAVWTGSFKLPRSDDKNSYCKLFNFVEIWDVDAGEQDRYVGLFRIVSFIDDLTATADDSIEYTLEHVMGTLLDDVLNGYREWGGSDGENTQELLVRTLDKQAETKWVLKECEKIKHYEYIFEDMNLLDVIYSIVQPIKKDYYWSFNTQEFPWGLNLKMVSQIPVTDIRYKKNIFGIKKTVDSKNLSTRLWLFGGVKDGSVVNVSNINGGKKYIDSETGIAEYGIISTIIRDEKFMSAQALYDYGINLLEDLDEPLITYTVDVKTIFNAANLKLGDSVRIVTDDGLDQILTVQQIEKRNLTGDINNGSIIIGKGMVELGIIKKSFI